MIKPLNWTGPYSWPGFEETNKLAPLPEQKGVYLQTFEFSGGYLIYAAGITRRLFKARFKEHSRSYLNGEYNVLDMLSIKNGIRNEHWHGWDYARNHRDEYERRRSDLSPLINDQLANFRLFVVDLGDEKRIHERVESAVMNVLYQQLPPISTIPDKGMFLSKKKDFEDTIIVENKCNEILWGLPRLLYL
ncbi:hypothetical protein [Vibrio superstes]|uniref:GIY-YIG domain-containing protein n=1 Tax=Vibrio superstes NBRC 103154 TaxID=1219062 RepID=A0A511QKP7_9VIBR|nr:hypothetical protein [Vibrio superstes]GEM77869.1 hypothetical protein VSU01S_01140 [Vibrio superstes NBRC 103154]